MAELHNDLKDGSAGSGNFCKNPIDKNFVQNFKVSKVNFDLAR
jgi:hypothetical protein